MPQLTLFANKLSALSNNFIDWSRAGEFISKGGHQYSKKEIETRAFIIATTAISAFLGIRLKNKYHLNASSLKLGIAFGAMGFLLSHSYAILPLFYKRYRMSAECDQLIKEIKTQAAAIPEISPQKLDDLVNHINQLNLANEKGSNASLTWGKRKRLLTELRDKIEHSDDDLLAKLRANSPSSLNPKQFISLLEEKAPETGLGLLTI